MALIDKASLLMVPSVYEDGTLYNVLPSGNKAPDETGNHNGYDQTRADFTFSRGSNLAATRVNANGLIEKGRENVFKHSNAFTTSPWSMSATLTSGQADKDGGTNAWLFAKSGLSNSDYYNDTTINGVQTFSIYAKKQSGVGIKPYFFGSVNGYATINLGDGSKYDASGAIIDYKAEAYNDNWWRISVTINASSGNWYIYVTDGTNTQTTTPITIQNAQLEYGLTASSYLDSGATTATAGVLENTPRIDYSSGAGALLLEPQRTNVLAYSEYISGWTSKSAVYHTNGANATTSPEGISNGWKITGDGTTSQHYVLQTSNYTNGVSYTCSIYAKADTLNYVQLIMGASAFGSTRYCNFDLSDGSIGSQGLDISNPFAEPMGNGWYRIGFTCSAISTASGNFFPVLIESKTSSFFEVNSTTSSIFLYGGQVESGSHVSSYVPTYGSAATRGADSCSVTGVSDVIGQTEGTMYAEVQVTRGGRLLLIGTTGNFIELVTTSGGVINAFVYNGTTQVNLNGTTTFATGDTIKVAFAYKANDFALYVNGTANGTDTSGAVPSSMAQIIVNDYLSPGYNTANGYKQAILFNERLSNTELATLTTL